MTPAAFLFITMKPFQKKLLAWFESHRRDLPWRRTYNPYHIWISEIMLQQTQMDRVVDYFNRWVKRFPDIYDLAQASEEEIFKLWEGLGYYARARNILKAADILVNQFSGNLPADHQALLNLPGIGKYTAGAIMSLAFNKEYPIVDANIERLFSRIFNIDTPVKDKENKRFIWQKAKELIPRGEARHFNQALMELGALVCTPRNPLCSMCPVQKHCEAFQLGVVAERPISNRSNNFIPIEMVTGILIHKGKIFIQKRLENDVWGNLWEFPGGRLKPGENPEEALCREYLEETEFRIGNLEKIMVVKHGYTRYRVTLHCYYCKLLNGRATPVLHAAQESRWVMPSELNKFAFPAGHRKLIAGIKNDLQKRSALNQN